MGDPKKKKMGGRWASMGNVPIKLKKKKMGVPKKKRWGNAHLF